MTNAFFKLMFFSLMLNIATGVMAHAIPVFDDDHVENRGGVIYNSNQSKVFELGLETEINAASNVQQSASIVDRILDIVGLGFINVWIRNIQSYTNGFIILIDNFLGGFFPEELHDFLFGSSNNGILYVAMNIGYLVGAFMLFSGRDVTS